MNRVRDNEYWIAVSLVMERISLSSYNSERQLSNSVEQEREGGMERARARARSTCQHDMTNIIDDLPSRGTSPAHLWRCVDAVVETEQHLLRS